MANVILMPEAIEDIDEILFNVEEFTGWRASADKLQAAFERQFELLALFPEMGVCVKIITDS